MISLSLQTMQGDKPNPDYDDSVIEWLAYFILVFSIHVWTCVITKRNNCQRRIQDRRTGRTPPCLNFFWHFENVDYITLNFFNHSQYTMFTLCISCYFLTTLGLCEGASKQSPYPRILPRWDRAARFWNSLSRHCSLVGNLWCRWQCRSKLCFD